MRSHHCSSQIQVSPWLELDGTSYKYYCSPHIAAWDYSTRLCFKYHWESNSCFLPSDFFINVHIRPMDQISSIVPTCPSIEFYQQYHLFCSTRSTPKRNTNELLEFILLSEDLKVESNKENLIKRSENSPESEALVSSCLLSSYQSSSQNSSIYTKNQEFGQNDNFVQQIQTFIDIIDSELKMKMRSQIHPHIS